MASTNLNIKIVKNNDIIVQFAVKDSFGVAINTTDFNIKWEVKKTSKTEALITKRTGGEGIIHVDPSSDGVFLVFINAIDTVNLDAGSYFHEAVLTDYQNKSVTLTDISGKAGAFQIREQFAIQD